MKTISVVVPTYNEEENVSLLTGELIREFAENLSEYDYEILFIDNNSKDNTREIIRKLCKENSRIRAIFNLKNFGPDNSPYYGLMQATGDCAILFCADFQDPIEMIHKMVREWEKGYTTVIGIKKSSKENHLVRCFRTMYYRLIKKIADTEIIEHFTGFGLYDRSFLEVMRQLADPIPFLRGIVAEYSGNRLEIPYEQQRRRAGKSHIHFWTLYDIAMRSFTAYTKSGLRIATFLGFFIALTSFLVALVYFTLKIVFWYDFNMGMAPVVIGIFFLGAIQLVFLGLIGEYILSINQRLMNRPLVIEAERINF